MNNMHGTKPNTKTLIFRLLVTLHNYITAFNCLLVCADTLFHVNMGNRSRERERDRESAGELEIKRDTLYVQSERARADYIWDTLLKRCTDSS